MRPSMGAWRHFGTTNCGAFAVPADFVAGFLCSCAGSRASRALCQGFPAVFGLFPQFAALFRCALVLASRLPLATPGLTEQVCVLSKFSLYSPFLSFY